LHMEEGHDETRITVHVAEQSHLVMTLMKIEAREWASVEIRMYAARIC
jgi:hypothetical protein